jgi:hypothetical protein
LPFAHDAFQAQPASGLEYLRAVAVEVFDELQAIILATQKCLQPALLATWPNGLIQGYRAMASKPDD